MEKTKTVLSLMLVIITILTALTTIAAAYAGGDDDDGDGNKQKAEEDSTAAIADCDDNEVERAGFDCISMAANDVEIETEPPEEESATLSVCKEVRDLTSTFEPEDFEFTVTGNGPVPDRFPGDNEDGCVDVTIGPGEYTVSEAVPTDRSAAVVTGDCVEESMEGRSATGEIQAGEAQECRFINAILPPPSP